MVVVQRPAAPLFVVFGATGNQGGSAVDHLVASERQYRVRCLTRSLSSAAARSLAKLGAQLVQVDLDSQAQLETAFASADYVFVVLDSSMGAESEFLKAKGIIGALLALPQKPVVIWSSLPPAKEVSSGKYTKVTQFDNKARIVKEAESTGLQIVSVEPAMYMENWLGIIKPRLEEDGSYTMALPADPKTMVPLVSIRRDLGGFVLAAAEAGIKSGRVLAFGDEVSFEDLAGIWGKVLGKQCRFVSVPPADFARAVGPELTEMWQYTSECGYYGDRTLIKDANLQVDTQSWEAFVDEHVW